MAEVADLLRLPFCSLSDDDEDEPYAEPSSLALDSLFPPFDLEPDLFSRDHDSDPEPFFPSDSHQLGLHLSGFDSYSDSDSDLDRSGITGSACPDNDDLDWETLDVEGCRFDERDLVVMMVGGDSEPESDQGEVVGDVEWELLLATGSYHQGEHDGFVYASEQEDFLFGEFDGFGRTRTGPAAAEMVVEMLPTVVMADEEVSAGSGGGGTVCAVCKEEIGMEERVKKLPCKHYYHGECILPWLRIRNTCPVCRHELQTDDVEPTDDAEYESWRASAARGLGESGDEEETGARNTISCLEMQERLDQHSIRIMFFSLVSLILID